MLRFMNQKKKLKNSADHGVFELRSRCFEDANKVIDSLVCTITDARGVTLAEMLG